jgi:hypothetical protein
VVARALLRSIKNCKKQIDMKHLHFKLAALLFGIALANACCAEKVSEIVLETETTHGPGKKIVIHLLTPLEKGGGVLGGSIEIISAGDHGFLYTSEGKLFIDNMYAGKFDTKDTLHYGYNRLWANGTPCFLSKVSKRQAKIIYDEKPIYGLQADGTQQVSEDPYRIFFKPVTVNWGSSNGGSGLIINHGMYVLRIKGGVLHVNGISYGSVKDGAEVRIIDGRVFVNGAVCLPQADQKPKEIEQGGADQPTTAPELKSEGKDNPQPESKVAPR